MSDAETAYAKLNLALHIRGRRADGYHHIETVFAFCEDGDGLELTARRGIYSERESRAPVPARAHLELAGPFAAGLDAGPGNLVHQAAEALRSAFGIGEPWSLRLDKRLPVASGIGGGSADAAAALRLLSRQWAIDSSDPRVAAIAARLGADVPACLVSRPAYGDGRGDQLRPIASAFTGAPVLLVNPGVALATAPVFAAWDGIDRGPLDPDDVAAGRNDLELPARLLCPQIGDVLDFLSTWPGALLTRMSGSGASCFALFEDEPSRDAAAAAVPRGWWRLATRLRG